MDVKKVALLIGALIVAAVTAVMARSMFAETSTPTAQAAAPQAVGPGVLVATKSLPVGTIIDVTAIKFQPWPKDLVQQHYFIEGQPDADPSKLIGTVVRNPITAGQPVTQGALVKPGDRGFLAAALGPGMRAISVPVSNTSGVAGFIFPGDRVDIMLSQDVSGGGEGEALKASETILRNVRVLATDQRVTAEDAAGKQVVQPFATVTLEVTPKIAEKIQVAQSIGQLSLALRSIADNTAELERAIAAGEIEVPESDDPNAEKRMLLAIATQPIDTNPTFTVGAEVSRFQRRSVPSRPAGNSVSGGGFPRSAPTYFPTPSAPSAPAQPVLNDRNSVRVARGNSITVVPVGAN